MLVIKLFVIGNGFDIDHDLECQFRCFKCYLKRTYPEIIKYDKLKCVPLPCTGIAPDGEEISDPSTDAQILYRLIEDIKMNSDWSSFEEDLGNIEYERLVDRSNYDNEDDDAIFHQVRNNSDLAREYFKSFDDFPRLFSDWIESIDTSWVRPKSKYKAVFSNDDLFLTFNYTDLLENTYGIPTERICHIHGKMGEQLIFGHDNAEDAYEADFLSGDADIYFNKMHHKLFKDTRKCINAHKRFLDRISAVDEIYFLGWSMATVDLDYLSYIGNLLSSKSVIIHFTKYDEEKNTIEDKIAKLKKYKIRYDLANNI